MDYTEEEIVDIGILDYRMPLGDFLKLPAGEQLLVHLKASNYFDKLKHKIENRRKLEEAHKKAREFKDMQRRERLGLLTPEELEQKRLKKEQKNQDWLDRRK